MFLSNKLNMGAGTPAAPADAQFNYVTMLLHGDGTNGAQNNTFLDSSTNNFTITRNGNTTQGSFSPYGSNWSNNFPTTSGDYLTIANNAAFTLGNTFTVECWLFRTASDDGTIVGRWYAGDSSGWLMHIFSGGKLAFGLGSGSYSNASASTIPLNTWTHLAVSNDTTSKRFYINGVLDATFSSDNCNSLGSINLTICQNTGGGYGIRSYISNLRIVKGTAVYTSNFTPPTAPLTAISGTSLLTCQSNRFKDNSTNNFTISSFGNTSVQRFNPFGASTAYSTSVIGGSGYFDGTGDYLTAPDNTALQFGTGDFTIECWVYLNAFASDVAATLCKRSSAAEDTTWAIDFATGTGDVRYRILNSTGGVITVSIGTVSLGTWTHIAVSKQSGTTRTYLNGIAGGTTTNSTSIDGGTNELKIGVGDFSSGKYINGYISNARLVKGTAVYTSAFTPPTSPLTAISGTSLLTSMTNGAIFDNAMMNNLETVGNAQISTSVVKYGTGSLAFDGTGDYLLGKNVVDLSFGTGDFTVECWAYWTATVADGGFVGSNSTGGMDFAYLGGTLRIGRVNTAWDSTFSWGTPTAGLWYHIAFTRNNGTARAFVNGTQVGSNSTNNNSYAPTGGVIIGASNGGDRNFKGYIDDLRITKGYARYTANFTPPTAAFSNTGPI